MTRTRTAILFGGAVLSIYVGSIFAGLELTGRGGRGDLREGRARMGWRAPLLQSIPNTSEGDSVRRGELLFDETPLYAAGHARARLSCSSCHAGGGMQPFASPLVGIPALFPMYNARAGRVISLRDRIQECFVRSENGTPLAENGSTMHDLLAYIDWISAPQPGRLPFRGRGLVSLPDLIPHAAHGRELYAAQCAGCHGSDGQGRTPLFPPVWGPDSFNDGAGMNGIRKMAAFVQHNMPQNRPGILSAQDAFDVAAYIHAQPRPSMNPAYKHF